MDEETDVRQDRDESAAARPVPRRRRLWRALAVLLVLAVVGAGALTARLARGPITTSIGTGALGEILAGRLGPGASASVGVVGLSIGADLRPVIHLRDVGLRAPDGSTVSVDTLTIGTAWRSLLGGDVRLSAIAADHVFVSVAASDGPPPTLPSVLAGIDGAVETTGVARLDLDSLTVRRAGADDASRTPLLDAVAIEATTGDGGRVDARIAGAGFRGPWSIAAAIGPGDERVSRQMTVTSRGLDIVDLAAMSGDTVPTLTGPVALEGRVGLSTGGALVDASGVVTVGPVDYRGGAGTPPLPDETRLNLAFEPDTGAIVLNPSTVMLPGGHAVIGGRIQPPDAADRRWRFTVSADGGESGPAGKSGEGTASGAYDPVAHLLTVDRFTVAGEGTRFTAAMRLSHGDKGVVGAVSGAFAELPVASLKALWPPMLAPGAWNWARDNLAAGTIRDARVDVAFSGDGFGETDHADARAGFDFRFDGASFRAFDDGPMIHDGTGTGHLADNRLEIRLDSGTADLGDGRTLAVGPASLVIADIVPDPPDGEITVHMEGDAGAAVALWKRIPLARASALDVDPGDATGRASADVVLRLPLVAHLPVEKVRYEGKVALSDLSLARPLGGRSIRDADLAITIGKDGARIVGKATVDGVAAAVDLTEPLDDDDSSASAVRLVLDDAARRKLGVDLGDMLDGTVSVSLESTGGGRDRQLVKVDLTKAVVRFPPVDFVKPKGKAASATFTLTRTDAGTAIDDLVLKLGAAAAGGSLKIDGDGRIVSADIGSLQLSAGDDLAVAVARKDGRYSVRLTGASLDGRTLIRRLLSSGDGGRLAGPGIDLHAALGRVTGFRDEGLSGFNLDASVDGGRLTALSLTAQTAGGGATSASLTPAGGARRIRVELGEVGRVLRFLDLYGRVFGGRATVTGTIDDGGVLRATVGGTRWKIVEEPALARLSTAAEEGPTAGLSAADIRRLRADVTFADGRLRIDDGVVRAETAGLSLQGDVDFRRNVIGLSGTYLPASRFDSLLGKIPLLGQTVFAGGRAGLLGVSFRLAGAIDDPALTVNPLSVIAPGIFRKLFEGD